MADLPNQDRMQIPLFLAILRRGGEILFSLEGSDIEDELAELYGLTKEQRAEMLTNPRTRRWRNHLQWVRAKLREAGDLEEAERDVWRVSDQGRTRAQMYLLKIIDKAPTDEVLEVMLSSPQYNGLSATVHCAHQRVMRRNTSRPSRSPRKWPGTSSAGRTPNEPRNCVSEPPCHCIY